MTMRIEKENWRSTAACLANLFNKTSVGTSTCRQHRPTQHQDGRNGIVQDTFFTLASDTRLQTSTSRSESCWQGLVDNSLRGTLYAERSISCPISEAAVAYNYLGEFKRSSALFVC